MWCIIVGLSTLGMQECSYLLSRQTLTSTEAVAGSRDQLPEVII